MEHGFPRAAGLQKNTYEYKTRGEGTPYESSCQGHKDSKTSAVGKADANGRSDSYFYCSLVLLQLYYSGNMYRATSPDLFCVVSIRRVKVLRGQGQQKLLLRSRSICQMSHTVVRDFAGIIWTSLQHS